MEPAGEIRSKRTDNMKNLFEIRKLVREVMVIAQNVANAAKEVLQNTGESTTHQVQAFDEEKRELAYHLWEKAGCPQGDGVEFWFKAEMVLADRPSDVDLTT